MANTEPTLAREKTANGSWRGLELLLVALAGSSLQMKGHLSIAVIILSIVFYGLYRIPADISYHAPLTLRTSASPEKVFDLLTDVRKYTAFLESPPNITYDSVYAVGFLLIGAIY